jgi:Arc/MetJ family transcription regulator
MRTTVEVNDKLLEEAMRASGSGTKKDAINSALKEYVRAKRREQLRKLIGGWDDFGLTLGDLEKMRRER